ncbi:MAG: thiazole biosynthesis protein [Chloroflexi bacterium]|nr:thiazole biosynthesis protein [Chloroflexota bacterium]MBM3172296.1 thiazole biosynthesis protein [Chloroflexota bacterium]MBM3174766.1 thiazole biosynthesis protein [Chloroflexota bacterium]MBM4450115.1 thiazole biosynthesis protein [Chloroflexota bacterium]
MDEVTISRAITESYVKELLDYMDVDVAIAGAGPSGLTAGYCLAKNKVKVAIFERKLSVGGGMWGGGMMFNKIVVQAEAKGILDELGISSRQYQKGYYVADAVETAATLCSRAMKAGVKIFNLLSVEDVMIRENGRITGLVLNWSAVSLANLHVDPLAIRAKAVIDATGHDADVCRVVARKSGAKLEVLGEKSMWAEVGEMEIVENTKEVCPGLLVAGMAANAVHGSPRMGAIFGGMLLSGKKAAELAMTMVMRGEA